MEALLNSIQATSWLVYLLIFVIMLIESAGAPIPGLTIVLAASALAGQGRLEVWFVFLATVSGGTLGGMLGYYIGQQGGRRLLERFGRYILLTPARLEIGERAFQRYGDKAVLFSRHLPVFCFMSGILSGISELPYRRFFFYNFFSLIIYCTSHMTLAFFFGRSLDVLLQTFNTIGLALLVAVAIVGLGVHLRRNRRRLSRKAERTVEPVIIQRGE